MLFRSIEQLSVLSLYISFNSIIQNGYMKYNGQNVRKKVLIKVFMCPKQFPLRLLLPHLILKHAAGGPYLACVSLNFVVTLLLLSSEEMGSCVLVLSGPMWLLQCSFGLFSQSAVMGIMLF